MAKTIKKNKKDKKKYLKFIVIILSILLLASVGLTNYFLSKVNYLSDDFEYQNNGVNSSELFEENGVLNILLTGSDSRTRDGEGRSDVMILLSINLEKKTVVMTSLMRDLQMPIPGYGTAKLNAAIVYGGHTLLMDTLYENLHIIVKKYIALDFYSFIDIIDAIGGVKIDVKYNEINACNDSIRELNRLQELILDDGYITESGTQLLSGKQALAYARLRDVGNADYERTARQRLVFTAVLNKIQEMNAVELMSVINVLLPELTTNLSKQDIIKLIPVLLKSGQYELIENRIPLIGENVHITDFSDDIEVFNQLIYGE